MLLRFHLVLIVSTLLFSVVYGAYRFVEWRSSGADGALELVLICSVGAIGSGAYLVYLLRGRLRSPSGGSSENGSR